ncbi:putative malate dehydrogenase 1B [Cololabis saira]|uniref:putative malate dehydrogenase 1B n=1 Tax=Cololabis saira TaxID=129043 RepID=UPI002AD1D22B|nr:putative malate dehydrogenase 1B [Cololabis saira]
MSKFVLAGKADCPHYAKAELLADALQGSLPNFRVHKVSILPDAWKEWLEATCRRNGWKHERSPLVWRELVEQGGNGILLGGFSEFLEHCQDYYGITSDMSTEMMLKIAAENLETQMSLVAEELNPFSQPLNIWITGVLSPTCHILIPHLLSTEVVKAHVINLHLLEFKGNEEELQGLGQETRNMALGVLYQVTVDTNLEEAFKAADVIILLDDINTDGENESDEEKNERVKEISERYKEYGRLIDTRAHKHVKVIVSGDTFVNLRCSLLADNARSIDSHQFVALATQLENEARAVVAKELKVRSSDVTEVIVWGNISGIFYIDLQRAKVYNYNGPIKGPAFFSLPVLQIFQDRNWLETDFQYLVRCQRAAVASKTGRAGAASAANGILRVLKAWHGAGDSDEVLSLGVLCPGLYNLQEGLVFSVPVTFKDGKWSEVFDVTVGDKLKEILELCAKELQRVGPNVKEK